MPAQNRDKSTKSIKMKSQLPIILGATAACAASLISGTGPETLEIGALISNISVNVASEPITKFFYRGLAKIRTKTNHPDSINHDLESAFGRATIKAITNIEIRYLETIKIEYSKKLYKIREPKIRLFFHEWREYISNQQPKNRVSSEIVKPYIFNNPEQAIQYIGSYFETYIEDKDTHFQKVVSEYLLKELATSFDQELKRETAAYRAFTILFQRTLFDKVNEVYKSVKIVESILSTNPSSSSVHKEPSKAVLSYTTPKLLTPQLMMGLRSKTGFHKDIYIARDHDQSISECILNKESILVTGKSLSGKSRALLQALNSTQVVSDICIFPAAVFIPDNFRQELDDYIDISINNEYNIVVINDIDEYCELDWFNKFTYQILSSDKHTLLATCKSKEYKYLVSKFVDFLPYVQKVKIPPISRSIRAKMEILGKRISLEENIDDTIGTYFISLAHMHDRYTKLTSHAQEVLRGAKIIDFLRSKNAGSLDLIQQHINLRAKIYYQDAEKHFTNYKFDETIKELESEYLISHVDELKIGIEQVYLDKIIAPELNEAKIANEIIKLYPDREDQYCRLIIRAESDDLAELVFKNLCDSSIAESSLGLRCLISRYSDIKDAIKVLKKGIKHSNLEVDSALINTCISRSSNIKEALETLHLFKEFEIEPDEITWFTLIKPMYKIDRDNLDWINIWLSENELNIPITFYNAMISASVDENTAFNLYLTLDILNLAINEYTIHGLLKHIKSPELLWIIILDAERFKVKVDNKFIQSCYNHIQNDEKIRVGFTMFLLNKGYSIPSFGVVQTLKSISSTTDSFKFLNLLPEDRYYKQSTIINEILKKSESLSESAKILSLAKKMGFSQTNNHANIILQNCKTISASKNAFEKLFHEDFTPDEYTYCHLIKVSRNFNDAYHYFQKARDQKMYINSVFFLHMLEKINPGRKNSNPASEIHLNKLFNDYLDLDLEAPEYKLFYMFVNKSRTLNLGLKIFDELHTADTSKPSIFNSLLKSARNLNDTMHVFKRIEKVGSKPTLEHYNLLLSKHTTWEKSWITYDEIVHRDFKPNMETFSRFLDGLKYFPDDKLFGLFDEAIKIEAIKNTPVRNSDVYNHINYFADKYFKRLSSYSDCHQDYLIMREHGAPVMEKAIRTIISKAESIHEFEASVRLFLDEGISVDEMVAIKHLKIQNSIEEKFKVVNEYKTNFNLASNRLCLYLIKDEYDTYKLLKYGIKYLYSIDLIPNNTVQKRFIKNGVNPVDLVEEILKEFKLSISSVDSIEQLKKCNSDEKEIYILDSILSSLRS